MTTPATPRVRVRPWVLLGVALVALVMRAPITGVPPVLERIAGDLSLGPTAAGLVTSLPLICFGAFAFATPFLTARIGLEPTLWIAAALIALGLSIRWPGSLMPFFTGTLVIGMGVALANVVVPALGRAWFPDRLAMTLSVTTVMTLVSATIGPSRPAGPWTAASTGRAHWACGSSRPSSPCSDGAWSACAPGESSMAIRTTRPTRLDS